tara:strand:- start:2444 stop:2599 length:156 start_codon:yes stop_codon:yes gene_type:complete
MIAINEPKCKLVSINSELLEFLNKLENITKWAEELTGINSDIPWIKDKKSV